MTALTSLASRVLFLGAFLLAGLAVLEKLANMNGYTILSGAFSPSRILDFTVIAVLFVIALQLREIKTSGGMRAG